MSRKSRYPFESSAQGLFRQMNLIRHIEGCNTMAILGEHRFHPKRKWRFDLAIPELKIACEYQGGLFMGRRGGHQSVKGTRKDWEKMNEAQICGWIVLQFGPDETRTGSAMLVIERAIKYRMESHDRIP